MKKIFSFIVIVIISKCCIAQVINVNDFAKYDSIIKLKKNSIDTLIIWGKYNAYIKNPFKKVSSEKEKLKYSISKTAIQFNLFETNQKVYYTLKSDQHLFKYNDNDIIKMQLIIYHKLLDELRNKIIIVYKIL